MALVKNDLVEQVTVGSAEIYINGVSVGFLKENVDIAYTRTKLFFKPANHLFEVKAYAIDEAFEIRAKTAQLNLGNIRLALGYSDTAVVPSTDIPAITGNCSYDQPALTSWDSLTIGGDKSENEFCVMVEHIRPNGLRVMAILYKAVSNTELVIPFAEDEFTLHDLVFKALGDTSRTVGDQIGMLLNQTN